MRPIDLAGPPGKGWPAWRTGWLVRSRRRWSAAGRAKPNATGRLNSLSPLAVLSRGYALVFDENGHLMKDAAQAVQGQTTTTRLARGTLQSRILEIQPDKKAEA